MRNGNRRYDSIDCFNGDQDMKRFREWLIPELRREPDEDRRWAAYRSGMAHSWFDWWMGACIPLSCLTAYLRPFRGRSHRLAPSLVYFFGNLGIALLIFSILMGVGFVALRSQIRRHTRARLKGMGTPICVPCGYDLTGNTNGICPECGAAGSVELEAWKTE